MIELTQKQYAVRLESAVNALEAKRGAPHRIDVEKALLDLQTLRRECALNPKIWVARITELTKEVLKVIEGARLALHETPTPYGTVWGPVEAVQYVSELVYDDTRPQPHAMDDRPMNTDQFIDRMLRANVPDEDIKTALRHWNEGAWTAAFTACGLIPTLG